jgi:hypothetical protein
MLTYYYEVVDVIRPDIAREQITCLSIVSPNEDYYRLAVEGTFDLNNPGQRATLEAEILRKLVEKHYAQPDDIIEMMGPLFAGEFKPFDAA